MMILLPDRSSGRVLTRLGLEVIEFPDGGAAWEYFLANPPRFVITDWLIPTWMDWT
jgi:DNA-binding response OmpR family regulator